MRLHKLSSMMLVVAATCCAVVAQADVAVSAAGEGYSFWNNYLYYDTGNHRDNSSVIVGDSRAVEDYWPSLVASSSQAQADLLVAPGLRLKSYSFASGGGLAQAETWAVAQWGDRLRTPADAAQDAIRVTMRISADFAYTSDPGLGQHQVATAIGLSNLSGGGTLDDVSVEAMRWLHHGSSMPSDTTSFRIVKNGGALPEQEVFGFSFSDSPGTIVHYHSAVEGYPSFNSLGSGYGIYGSVTWEQSFLIPYVPADESYNLNIMAFGTTSAWHEGEIGLNAFNTIELTAVLSADGSPLNGPVQFDSGFQLPSVPEPGSLLMAAMAVAMGAICCLRKRRAK